MDPDDILLIFFSGKSLKICSYSNFFRGLTYDFLNYFFPSFVQKKSKSTIEQQNVKLTENVVDF